MNISDIKDIIYKKEDNGICTATLNIPERKNAMSFVTFLELETILADMEADKNAKILIITGAEEAKAFSSGGYFNMNLYPKLPKEILDELDLTDIAVKRLCMKFWDFSKPVIAAINGLAVGAGFTMPLAGADLIYMADDAWIGFYFIRRAVMAEFSAHFLLPFYLGFQKTKEILYFGKKLTAKEVEELKLINKVVPHNNLMEYTREKALELIPPKGPSLSIKLMKKTMHNYFKDILSQTLDLENEGLRELLTTHDFRESMKSLVTKKTPKFKGK
ncbi:MAG: enoyl-CoA hydratase [Candidatus Lokiarchaeota archaeon]|nr:enoyl-CoA hydratase [Candidatus Lokiarchaeota archaeon]MBD3200453.1 enoyl-CoA hydratase [Candidatus Lokiarchaeota archaeon]